jgi:hypothetical protein
LCSLFWDRVLLFLPWPVLLFGMIGACHYAQLLVEVHFVLFLFVCLFDYFWSHKLFFNLGWPSTKILPISASWVAWDDRYMLPCQAVDQNKVLRIFLPTLGSNHDPLDLCLPSR